jgi:hypothetical protein
LPAIGAREYLVEGLTPGEFGVPVKTLVVGPEENCFIGAILTSRNVIACRDVFTHPSDVG